MSGADASIPTGGLIAVVATFMLPMGLGVVLNYMRPDLMAPMLDHVFGYVLVGVVLALTLAGTAAVGVAAFADKESTTPRVLITIGGLVLCTAPAVFLVLFGPIVFAFMFGNVVQ